MRPIRIPFVILAAVMFVTLRADPAQSGIAYRFESASAGLAVQTVRGRVEAEGDRMRIDIERGDGALFTNGSYAVVTGGGARLAVADPATRTWYELSSADLSGGGASLLRELRSTLGLSISNPRVTVRDLGAGPIVAGFPTRHRIVESSCSISAAGSGKLALSVVTETWATDRIPLQYRNVLELRGVHTGIPELDRLIDAQPGAAAGFPMREISTTRIGQNGSTMETKTTTTVSEVRPRSVPASRFSIPAGYAKTQNPIEKAMKALGVK